MKPKGILSIQSHVAYGYVGNKAATFPLQCMGYDVWPINTVQFSNHTGYGKWEGKIFDADDILKIANQIIEMGWIGECVGILSGYMGSKSIAEAVFEVVSNYKKINKKIIYLCDPVIGSNTCYVKPEIESFFKANLSADIITPNQREAEVLSDMKITDTKSLRKISDFFHQNLSINIVVITGLQLEEMNGLYVFLSDKKLQFLIKVDEHVFKSQINGTGDLLSSLYLGSYLNNRNPIIALQQAVYYMDVVIKNTARAKSKELQVISTDYKVPDAMFLPRIIKI